METTESLEAIQSRHKKEAKELQGRITQKKKNATKKTRKGVNDECEKLEQELKDRQQQELSALNGDNNAADEDAQRADDKDEPLQINGDLKETAEKSENDSISPEPKPPTSNGGGQKRNRQKERLARRAAEVEAQSLAASKEASSIPNHKSLERTKMLTTFSANNLSEVEIAPDGHCLFNALADQLESNGIFLQRTSSTVSGVKAEPKYKILRRVATEYMEANREDFEAFVDEDFEGYLRKIRDTAEWGGQLELLAVARRFEVEIRVVQDGGIEKIEPGVEGKEVKTLWLAYYRHGYGLGEHYNALRKKEDKS